MEDNEFICIPLSFEACSDCSDYDVCENHLEPFDDFNYNKQILKNTIDEELKEMDLNRNFRMGKMILKDPMEASDYPYTKFKLPYIIDPKTGKPIGGNNNVSYKR